MIGAWLLNPVCFYIFLAGGLLEAVYCLLWRVTPLRAMINGIVKTLGAVAAVYAVNPQPSVIFIFVLFGWIFFWEIGGQNIPNDWTDIEEDRRFRARTIPVKLGLARAGLLALACLVAAFLFTFLLAWGLTDDLRFHSPAGPGRVRCLAAAACRSSGLSTPTDRKQAMDVFNKASYFPLSVVHCCSFSFGYLLMVQWNPESPICVFGLSQSSR